jgi:hypothetical protein
MPSFPPSRGKRGELVGVIVTEEYVCDFCSKPITDPEILVGRLSMRKQGARGLGREVALTLHGACLDKLTEHAGGTHPARRAQSEPAAEEPAAPAPKRRSSAKPRKARSSFSGEGK